MWFPQPVHEGFPQLRQVIREHMFLAEWPTGKKSFGFWTGVFMVAVVVVAVNGEQRRKYRGEGPSRFVRKCFAIYLFVRRK